MRKYLAFGLIALAGALTALAAAHWMGWGNPSTQWGADHAVPMHFANYTPGGNGAVVADFTYAAEKALPEVVHIAASVRMKHQDGMMQGLDLQDIPEQFRHVVGNPGAPQQRGGEEPNDMQEGTGSRVILSADG